MKNKQKIKLKMITCWVIVFIPSCEATITPVASRSSTVYAQKNEAEATVDMILEENADTELLRLKESEKLESKISKTIETINESDDSDNIESFSLKGETIVEKTDISTKNSHGHKNDFWTTLSSQEQKSLLNLEQYDADPLYNAKPVLPDDKNFELTVKLVFGEAGFEDFAGKCLVAQAIRDTYLNERNAGNMDIFDLKDIKKEYQYAGKINHSQGYYNRFNKEYQECVDAVTYILTNGQSAIQHRVIFFYAPKYVQSRFHETKDFVIEHGGHRFFDNVNWQ